MRKIFTGYAILLLAVLTGCTKHLKEKQDLTIKEVDGDFGITPSAHVLGYWEQRDFHTGASGFENAESVFELNGKAYVYGWGSIYVSGELWEYDDNTITWTRKADLPSSFRKHISTFSLNGKGYIVAGERAYSAVFLKEVWEYNPIADSWTRKADFPGTARHKAIGFSVNGKGYFGLGSQLSGVYSDFYEYNPVTDVWIQKASFPALGRQDAFSFSASGKGYVGTGHYFSYSPMQTIYFKDLWEYNPITNSWNQKADYPGGYRTSCASFTVDNHGHVGTGYDPINDKHKKDFYAYYPSTNVWHYRFDFGGISRRDAIGFAQNGYGFIGFGETASGDGEKALWRFTPFD